jgi:transcriptional regulator with XRE-family HTH domain
VPARALGKRCKALRLQKGLSQTVLSYEADLDRSTIIRIETGKIDPSLDLLFVLAKALGVHPKELLDFPLEDSEL